MKNKLVHLKNLKEYTPKSVPPILKGLNVTFLQSDTGEDFYEAIKKMQEDTVKVVYTEDGIVRAFSKDASSLSPRNASMIEVLQENIPEELEPDRFKFNPDTCTFSLNTEFIEHELEIEKDRLLFIANRNISYYQDKVDLETATDVEVTALKNWKAYRVNVHEATDLGSLPKQPSM